MQQVVARTGGRAPQSPCRRSHGTILSSSVDGKAPRSDPATVLCVAPTLDLGAASRHWVTLLPDLIQHGLRPWVVCAGVEGRYAPQLRRQGISVAAAGMAGPLDLRPTPPRPRPRPWRPGGRRPELRNSPSVHRASCRSAPRDSALRQRPSRGRARAAEASAGPAPAHTGAAGVIAVTEDQVEDLASRVIDGTNPCHPQRDRRPSRDAAAISR